MNMTAVFKCGNPGLLYCCCMTFLKFWPAQIFPAPSTNFLKSSSRESQHPHSLLACRGGTQSAMNAATES